MTSHSSQQATGWTGWIAFASLLLIISGALTAIAGFLAIINNNWSQWNNNGAPYGTAYGWGWWYLIVGLIVMAIGGALMRGSMFARTVAVLVATASLISHFISLYITPIWSITIITMNVLIIWAVIVHGSEVKDAA